MRVNGHELYIEEHGPRQGLPVVLLHQGLGSTRDWKVLVPVLAAAGMRVLVYDRWGYGRSEGRDGLGQPEFVADGEDLEALLMTLDFGHPVLVGHSDGGTIALQYAARHPEQGIRALVTVAAHIYVEPKMLPGIQGVRLQMEMEPAFREGLRRVHGDRWEQAFRNWYEGWLRPENLAWDLRPALRSVRCPALVVQGEEDEHATPQHAQDLASALPCAELWLVPGAGHMFPQESSQVFNRRLLEFLAKVGKLKVEG